ncbi:MAG: hypothetical protein JJE40_02110 [Vicinamibacteria bacterium]|nr:hypothetical protein [Vicinamibacteria bacterium]
MFGFVASALATTCASVFVLVAIVEPDPSQLPDPHRSQPDPSWGPPPEESQGRRDANLTRPARANCPEDAAEYFFAPGTFNLDDAFQREWYGSQLNAMRQKSMSCGRQDGDSIYRFTWLRSFHQPMVVQVSRTGEEVRITGVELDGKGGYEPGAVVTTVNRRLSVRQWTTLTSGLARAAFWGMRTEGKSEGEDGARWILEARHGNSYHVVNRWSPREGPFREACLRFLRLAGLMPADDYVY